MCSKVKEGLGGRKKSKKAEQHDGERKNDKRVEREDLMTISMYYYYSLLRA